jgi:diaminopimelate epimerase
MDMTLDIVRANPAGNVTIIVLSPVETYLRPTISKFLLHDKKYGAEQVGFMTTPSQGAMARLEMMGGEFCGNAARAFGLYVANKNRGAQKVNIEMSGADHPLTVYVTPELCYASTQMPLPQKITENSFFDVPYIRVDFEGISHIVVQQEPNKEIISATKNLFLNNEEVFAWGIMFFPSRNLMIPVVHVKAMGFEVWESSCGSGSVAAAIALSLIKANAIDNYSFTQPGGVIKVYLEKINGHVQFVSIGGNVTLDEPRKVTVPKELLL